MDTNNYNLKIETTIIFGLISYTLHIILWICKIYARTFQLIGSYVEKKVMKEIKDAVKESPFAWYSSRKISFIISRNFIKSNAVANLLFCILF